MLAATTQPAELLAEPFETLLYHLFHEEHLRLHDAGPVVFGCSCSQPRAATTLRSIGEAEARAVLEEQGLIRIQCELCQQEYRFDETALDRLFEAPADEAGTVH